MTGAEVLIKNGNNVILGKVRHSGYDVKEFFKGKKIFKTDYTELWKKYLEFRRKDFSDVCLKSEITTEYDNGFCNIFVEEPVITNNDEFYSLVKHIESLIESSNPEDGYLCGYTDYMVLVDYDKKKVTFF